MQRIIRRSVLYAYIRGFFFRIRVWCNYDAQFKAVKEYSMQGCAQGMAHRSPVAQRATCTQQQ